MNIFTKLSGNSARPSRAYLNKLSAKRQRMASAYQNMSRSSKRAWHAMALGAFLMSPQLAFAADGTELLCFVAQYFKTIAGTAVLIVIGMWAIEHFFGVSKLHDITIKVGIGAAFVVSAATLVAKSGLTSSCLF